MHLNKYLASLADMWPSMKLEGALNSSSAPPPESLFDGLVGAGVKETMMGVAVAGYANTVGAKLEDTSLRGTCFLESEWDADGDRTFVLKVGLDFDGIDGCMRGVEWVCVCVFFCCIVRTGSTVSIARPTISALFVR